MYVFKQVDKHKSRPDSLPSCAGFALANMLISVKKIKLYFSAWWRDGLAPTPARVHPIMPGRAGGGGMGSMGWGHG